MVFLGIINPLRPDLSTLVSDLNQRVGDFNTSNGTARKWSDEDTRSLYELLDAILDCLNTQEDSARYTDIISLTADVIRACRHFTSQNQRKLLAFILLQKLESVVLH